MKAYLILDLAIKDGMAFMEYVKQIPDYIKKHDGKYIVEGVVPEVVEGEWSPERMVVLEFSSKENARSFLSDPEVQPLFAIRRSATKSNLLLVDGSSWKA